MIQFTFAINVIHYYNIEQEDETFQNCFNGKSCQLTLREIIIQKLMNANNKLFVGGFDSALSREMN